MCLQPLGMMYTLRFRGVATVAGLRDGLPISAVERKSKK